MIRATPEQVADWFMQCRVRLAEMRNDMSNKPPDQLLTELRDHYQTLAVLRNVCTGKTYLTGVPRKRSIDNAREET